MAVSRLSQSTIQNAFPKYNSAWDGVSAVGSMEAIGAVTLSATQSTITFDNIPQTYSHLQIRAFTGNTGSATNSALMYLNSDTSVSNYVNHHFQGNGTSVTAGYYATGGANVSSYVPWALGTSTYPAATIIDILDYTSTNKYKTIRQLNGYDSNGSGLAALASTLWISSNAISKISFSAYSANFSANSSFTLYGIK